MPASPDFTPPTRIDDQPELGEIKINHAVVASIARLAALNVPGVAAIGGGLADGLSELFSKRESESRGVRVVEEPSGAYALELRIAVTFGSSRQASANRSMARRYILAAPSLSPVRPAASASTLWIVPMLLWFSPKSGRSSTARSK